jgi:hypothetical protein
MSHTGESNMHAFLTKYVFSRQSLLALLVMCAVFAGQCQIGCSSEESAPVTVVETTAQIAVLAPAGGETYKPGDSLTVRWKLQGIGLEEVNSVNIEISPDSGKTWVTLLTGSIPKEDPHFGTFKWKILPMYKGGDYTANRKVRIRVMQYGSGNPDQIAVSNNTFSIIAD